MGRLDGKVILITGAATGMGKAHAERVYGEGAHVVIADVDDAGARALADELGDRASAVPEACPVAERLSRRVRSRS